MHFTSKRPIPLTFASKFCHWPCQGDNYFTKDELPALQANHLSLVKYRTRLNLTQYSKLFSCSLLGWTYKWQFLSTSPTGCTRETNRRHGWGNLPYRLLYCSRGCQNTQAVIAFDWLQSLFSWVFRPPIRFSDWSLFVKPGGSIHGSHFGQILSHVCLA